jgi:hypothetical protein
METVTPLKPIENRRVRGVASERYPLNTVCAHPECTEPVSDPHHCFPRSQIVGDSWFVEIEWLGHGSLIDGEPVANTSVIPHVTGLCRGHHDDVERHRAWIKLEDGEFRWYDRQALIYDSEEEALIDKYEHASDGTTWVFLGPLNPQPGSREGKPKKKPHKGEAKRERGTWSVKVPKDERENGAQVLDELYEACAEKLADEEGDSSVVDKPKYYNLVKILYDWRTS